MLDLHISLSTCLKMYSAASPPLGLVSDSFFLSYLQILSVLLLSNVLVLCAGQDHDTHSSRGKSMAQMLVGIVAKHSFFLLGSMCMVQCRADTHKCFPHGSVWAACVASFPRTCSSFFSFLSLHPLSA